MLTGIAMKIASTLLFAGMLALVKMYSQYPVAQLVFFRSFFALFVLVAWLLWRGDFPRALYTKWLSGHLVRSFAGVGSMFLMFASYGFLPLADVTALGYASPLLVVVLAALLLDEKVTRARWSAVIIGFAGVIVILWDNIGFSVDARRAIGAICAVCGACLVAVAMIQTRRLTRSEDTGAIVFYFQTTTTLASFAVILAAEIWPATWPMGEIVIGQAWVWPQAADWWPLIAIGLLGGLGQIFMTQSYRLADASIIACFDYTSMLWALVLGLLIFGDLPSAMAMTGAGIIVFGGLLAIQAERKTARR
jgi:drug/metabolite transporter (DMT)-like permease